jgi:hypothetical protein
MVMAEHWTYDLWYLLHFMAGFTQGYVQGVIGINPIANMTISGATAGIYELAEPKFWNKIGGDWRETPGNQLLDITCHMLGTFTAILVMGIMGMNENKRF